VACGKRGNRLPTRENYEPLNVQLSRFREAMLARAFAGRWKPRGKTVCQLWHVVRMSHVSLAGDGVARVVRAPATRF
jgi:hypothetical protein